MTGAEPDGNVSMMDRRSVQPLEVRDAPVMELPPTSDMWVPGARRRVLSHDEVTGEITYISELPPGYRREHEVAYREGHPPGRFEYHDCHEEGFILDGRYDFGGWYDWDALSYLNHPPTWVHPADQCVPDGARLLMKLSGPLAFEYTDIPSDWDGTEFAVDPARAAPWPGVTRRELGAPGRPTADAEWTELWNDPVRGWTTWFGVLAPGWRGSGQGFSRPGGDEVFVLEGDVSLRIGGDLHTLTAGQYACDARRYEDGGEEERSTTGCVLIRWTRDAAVVDA